MPCLKYSESIAKIRDAAFKFVSLRPKSHLHVVAPYNGRNKDFFREQTHSSESQLC